MGPPCVTAGRKKGQMEGQMEEWTHTPINLQSGGNNNHHYISITKIYGHIVVNENIVKYTKYALIEKYIEKQYIVTGIQKLYIVTGIQKIP